MSLIAALFKSTVFRTDLLSRKGAYTPILFSKTVFRTDLLPSKGVHLPTLYKVSLLQWSALPKKTIAIATRLVMRNDSVAPNYGGSGFIEGTVKLDFTPIKRKVRLYEASTGVLIREMWTNDVGVYLFTGLNKGLRYTLTSTYGDDTYNDVISSNITAV